MMTDLDVAAGFAGGIPPISLEHAVKRVVSFCCEPRSGWQSYDLAGAAARAAGHFRVVAPWSLLWADALAGQLSVGDLSGFTLDRRTIFAQRISAVSADKDLAAFTEKELAAVHSLCTFGYPGVWAPKSTKVSSLYRPRAVPILDGYVAMAFGFKRGGFSEGREPRWNRVARVVDAMAAFLKQHPAELSELRDQARDLVVDIDVATDLRLLDIVIWCSQDDLRERAGKKRNVWLDAPERQYDPNSVAPIPVS